MVHCAAGLLSAALRCAREPRQCAIPLRHAPARCVPGLQKFCALTTRRDGSIRLAWPWRKIGRTNDATPLRAWMGDWLQTQHTGQGGLPLVSLFCFLDEADTDLKLVFFKGY